MRRRLLVGMTLAALVAACRQQPAVAERERAEKVASLSVEPLHVPAPTPKTTLSDDVYCHPEACTQEGFVRVVESVPTALRRVEPEYPAEALANGLEGSAIVEVSVNQHGRVVSACVRSGPAALRPAAAEAAMRWEWSRTRQIPPAEHYCVTATLTFNFKQPKPK